MSVSVRKCATISASQPHPHGIGSCPYREEVCKLAVTEFHRSAVGSTEAPVDNHSGPDPIAAPNRFPDDAPVVKGGLAKPVRIDTFEEPGVGQVTGTSVSCNPGKTIAELSQGLPHGQARTSTVGKVRQAGGDVIPTRRSPNSPDHATLIGLDPQQIDRLLDPPIPNPTRK